MKIVLAAILLAASFGVSATNNPPNECGNHGNNCQPSGGSNEANSHANGGNGYGGSGTGVGVGVGLGIGQGGAGGEGGEGGRGGAGGTAISGGGAGGSVLGSGNSSNLNSAKGGDAVQGQQQSNVGVNSQGQSSTNVSGSKSIAQMASENSNKVNASSQNANQSSASGNTTVVGGDSTLVERNAPPVFLGAITPTSCGGSFSAGGSDRNGSGAFGFSFVGTECAIRMLGDRYQALGMLDTSCELYKSTKAFQKAAKRNPKLADLDCSIKPAPVPVVVPALVAPEIAHRVPRG